MNEPELLQVLASLIAVSGFRVDSALLIHLYVTLKSSSLLILHGPAGSGKSAAVESLTRILVSNNPEQYQPMVGHAWWAERSGNVALLTEAQVRLNTGKIMLLRNQASLPQNANRLYFAYLNGISPAEISGFFSDMAFQIQHDRLMCLPAAHFATPVSYPSNLILLGTMNSSASHWLDDNYYSVGSAVEWQSETASPTPITLNPGEFAGAQAMFLQSRIRDVEAANNKLTAILGDTASTIQPLQQIADVLNRYELRLSSPPPDRALIYLANAWSKDGFGLYDQHHRDNLECALDRMIAGDILQPLVNNSVESPGLIEELQHMLKGRFPNVNYVLSRAAS